MRFSAITYEKYNLKILKIIDKFYKPMTICKICVNDSHDMFVLTNGQIVFCLVLFTMSRYPGEFMTNLHVLQEHLLIFQNNLGPVVQN